MSNVNAVCYLVLRPELRGRDVVGARVVKITQTRPAQPEGYPMIRLNLSIPKSVFNGIIANINVPENAAQTIEASVETPTEQ